MITTTTPTTITENNMALERNALYSSAWQTFITSYKEQKHKIVMCVLNFSKAFDCLDIPIMLNSLHKSGVRGKALKWIDSWCLGNKFRFKVNESIVNSVG